MSEIKRIIEIDKDLYESIAGKNSDTVEPRQVVRSFQATIADAIAHSKPYEADRWIPVSERLPDKFEDVIVRDIEVTRTYSGYYIGDGLWCCDDGTHRDRITHWRHFPEYKDSEA